MTGRISPRFWGGTFQHETSQKRVRKSLTGVCGSVLIWCRPVEVLYSTCASEGRKKRSQCQETIGRPSG